MKMDDNDRKSVNEAELKQQEAKAEASSGGGGWGGWGFSSSIFTDLQKAAEEISRNAAEVAKSAAKSISEIQDEDENTESKEEKSEGSGSEDEEDEKHQLKKSALDKLEKAGEDSILGQGLKVIDDSVENFASGAWQALGNAWRGGTDFVHKLENSAVNLAESIQQGVPTAAGSVAPSLLETGKAFTTKGIQVLEFVGKETMDLIIAETGIDIDKNSKGSKGKPEDDQLHEEMTFDRCFYIYGGPEQLEELEALSNHYALLFNRRKAKLSAEEKSIYDGKLKDVQQIFDMSVGIDGNNSDLDKGKKIEGGSANNDNEMKVLHDSSVKKAANMAAGFASTLSGLAAAEMIQKTSGRLEALHSEGVHRLSEMCCYAVSQLLMLGKSVMSSNNKGKDDEDEDTMKIDWPEDTVEKAKFVRSKAQLMTENVEAVSNSFITGISDVAEVYMAAIQGVAADSNEPHHPSVLEKVKTFSEHLRSDQIVAVGKIQDGLQYLPYLVLSSSMAAA